MQILTKFLIDQFGRCPSCATQGNRFMGLVEKQRSATILYALKFMADESNKPVLVRAKYTFKGKNNDELTFSKGDTITLTQKLDGGWWEGTLNGKTGWFPSNYVIDVKSTEKPSTVSKSPVNGTAAKPVSDAAPSSTSSGQEAHNRNLYRNMILRNLLESDREHVRELKQLLDSYLKPLRIDALLPESDYTNLVGNLEQVLQFQASFLKTVEEHVRKPVKEQRIGGEFMRLASTLKTLLRIYCENHPVAVEALNKNKDLLTTFMQKRGGDLMVLITGLSRPFRHLEKYPSILQELERNLEESHPDRGDTQRAIAVYRDISKFCGDTRKQKEMQLELLSGMVSGWEGEPISSMGEIIYMGTVQVATDEGEKEDCCLVLLTGILLVLQISFQLNTYIFKRKIQLGGACVRKNAEMTLSNGTVFTQVLELRPKSTAGQQQSTNPVVMLYTNPEELNKWMELFQSVDGVILDDSCVTISPTTPLQYSTVQNSASPLIKPQVSTLPAPGHAEFLKNKSASPLATSWRNGENDSPQFSAVLNDGVQRVHKSCLRPLPPQRVNNAVVGASSGKANIKLRKKELVGHVFDQEETELLKIVESYCISERTKPTVVRRNFDSPHLIVAEDEKIFVEEMVGDEIVVQERTLVDTVYTLKDQVSTLREEVRNLAKLLESEQKSRKRIEELVRKHILSQRNSASASSSTPAFSLKSQPNENGFAAATTSPTPASEDGALSKRSS